MDIAKTAHFVKKTFAVFSYPYAQKSFRNEKALQKPRKTFSLGVNPQTPETFERGKVAQIFRLIQQINFFNYFFQFNFLCNLSNGGDSPTPPFGGTPPALRLPPAWNSIQFFRFPRFLRFFDFNFHFDNSPKQSSFIGWLLSVATLNG